LRKTMIYGLTGLYRMKAEIWTQVFELFLSNMTRSCPVLVLLERFICIINGLAKHAFFCRSFWLNIAEFRLWSSVHSKELSGYNAEYACMHAYTGTHTHTLTHSYVRKYISMNLHTYVASVGGLKYCRICLIYSLFILVLGGGREFSR
jgi:hypothetical protein